MRNQFRQRRRDLRWRMNKQMNNRRRLNLFLVERRVRHLEGRQEVLVLDLENSHDLMTDLEIKVKELLEDKRKREAEMQGKPLVRCITRPDPRPISLRFWHWLRDVLCAKGKP